MTAAGLVAVDVEGWTLFRQGEGYLVRDLDLAGQAEMASPRDIRRTIATAAREGLFNIVGAAHDVPTAGAYAIAVPEASMTWPARRRMSRASSASALSMPESLTARSTWTTSGP